MKPLTSMDEQFIKKLTQVIDENLKDEDFGASELAAQLGMSRVTLYRKVKTIIKKSVAEFIRETRLKRAYEMLHQKTGTVSEIAYDVGFSHPQYFNKCFQDYYGVTPGDVLKGIPVNNIKREHEKKKLPFSKKQVQFFSYTVLLVVAVLVIYLFVPPFPFRKQANEIPILVIPPFNDENPGTGNAKYLRYELHNRLKNLTMLIVKDQSMTEDSTFLTMGPEKLVISLKADYVLKCTRTLTDNGPQYFFRLLDKEGNVKWNEPYYENEKSTTEFAINVASFIVSELEIELSPEEKEQIQKLPTENVFALKMYEAGDNLSGLPYATLEDKKRALEFYEIAIKHDSTFANAYAKLASYYLYELPDDEKDIQKAKSYILKALKYDSKNGWFNGVLIGCFEREGNKNAADSCRKIVSQLPPGDDKYYYAGKAYENYVYGNTYESIRYALMYYNLNEGSGEPIAEHLLYETWNQLSLIRFPEVAKKYLIMMMAHWGNDTTNTELYSDWLSQTYLVAGDWEKSKVYALKVLNNDTSWYLKNFWKPLGLTRYLLTCELNLGNIEESYYYAESSDSIRKANNIEFNPYHGELSYGFACLEAGKKEKAMFVINREIETCLKEIEQNDQFAKWHGSHMNLAAIYAYLGDRNKTLKYLTEARDSGKNTGYQRLVLDIPAFDRIASEDREIRKVINDIKKQYEKEHRKIENLLKQEGLLAS